MYVLLVIKATGLDLKTFGISRNLQGPLPNIFTTKSLDSFSLLYNSYYCNPLGRNIGFLMLELCTLHSILLKCLLW